MKQKILLFSALFFSANLLYASGRLEQTTHQPKNQTIYNDQDLAYPIAQVVSSYPHAFPLLVNALQKINSSEPLSVRDFENIKNELEKFVDQESLDRAPRPNALSANANDAVVGKNGCDLTQVLALLAMIKKKIEILQQIICEKFAGTFSVLANLSITVSVDFSEVFTVLEEIENDIFDSRTILCEKFAGTFSVLEEIEDDIFDSRTILCEKFAGTFSVLEEIEDDIFDSRTILCEKFAGTFSVLANLSITVSVDFSEVFTALEEIEDDIFDTRTILCEKFAGTFSVLEEIEDDIFDTRTILCEKFAGTFSVLANLSITVSVDFSEVFTALEEIEDDIFDTRTILCEKFAGTFSVLEEIEVDIFDTQTIICDKFFQTWTILGCMRAVPVSQAAFLSAPGTYCLTNDIVGTVTVSTGVTLDLNGFSISGAPAVEVATAATDIAIKNGTLVGSTIGVDAGETGNTSLTINSVSFIDNQIGVFLTTATNVVIENCGFRGHTNRAILANDLTTMEVVKTNFNINMTSQIIEINFGHNLKFTECEFNNNGSDGGLTIVFIQDSANIIFLNCWMNENFAGGAFTAIESNNNQNFKFENSAINTNVGGAGGVNGIFFGNGNRDILILNSDINQNTSNGFTNGIAGDGSLKIVIKNTQANNNLGSNSARGFNFEGCVDVICQNCFALTNSSNNETSGFRSMGSQKVIFEACIANDNLGTNTGIGFDLRQTNSSCVLDCIAKLNQGVLDTGRGILLLDCIDNMVQSNLLLSNFGAITGIGLEVSNTGGAGILSTGIFSNKSQAHSANYIVTPGAFLQVFYVRATAIPSAIPTVLDNIDIS